MTISREPANSSQLMQRFLNGIEWAGNKLPDPAFLFVWAILITVVASHFLASMTFEEIDPRIQAAAPQTSAAIPEKPADRRIKVIDQLSGKSIVTQLAGMVKTFTDFPPLGVVLVALLGVGVAEHTGFIQAMLRAMLRITPVQLLTPMLILVALLSHSAGDTGYVLIIPLGAVMFSAAGRHPLSGITAAFAGVSGGFSANFLPSSLDPLLQGFTQQAAQLIQPDLVVNPLCNYWFMTASCVFIVGIGWFVTDRIIEPRLKHMPVDESVDGALAMDSLSTREAFGLTCGLLTLLAGLSVLLVFAMPPDSPLRANGSLTDHNAPIMKAIVPLIFFLFLFPGIVYGMISGSVKSHRDIVQGMTKSMGTISYYLVMAFFAAQFTAIFSQSNIGVLLAVKGANFLAAIQLPPQITIVGIILLTTAVNLLIGSASAKWALLSPIFVPMLMSLGISPELTQAAYRIGDSSTNIITPLMPYFPLVVAYSQRYVKSTGLGTMISLMLPYSLSFLIGWTVLLLLWWTLGLPLGVQADYLFSAK